MLRVDSVACACLEPSRALILARSARASSAVLSGSGAASEPAAWPSEKHAHETMRSESSDATALPTEIADSTAMALRITSSVPCATGERPSRTIRSTADAAVASKSTRNRLSSDALERSNARGAKSETATPFCSSILRHRSKPAFVESAALSRPTWLLNCSFGRSVRGSPSRTESDHLSSKKRELAERFSVQPRESSRCRTLDVSCSGPWIRKMGVAGGMPCACRQLR